jgi:hypothetical protein
MSIGGNTREAARARTLALIEIASSPMIRHVTPERRRRRRGTHPRGREMAMQPKWRCLEANADRPEIQAEIRHEIRKGTIRIVPGPDGSIRIIPILETSQDPESRARISA